MGISRALVRLRSVRASEEEQARNALELAAGELRRLEQCLETIRARERLGRSLVAASAASGKLEDRLAGIEEERFARSAARSLVTRIADAEREAAARREEFLAKRVERRQAETLIEEAEARERLSGSRRMQQSLDDWFLSRRGIANRDGQNGVSEAHECGAERKKHEPKPGSR